MTKNVTLMGASYPDVPSVLLPQTGGGTAEFFADKAGWFGTNAELVKELDTINWTLADTSYSSWTPGTSQTSIKAAQDYGTFVADLANYEYVVVFDVYIGLSYPSNVTAVPRVMANVGSLMNLVAKRPSQYQYLVDKNYNANANQNTNIYLNDYVNSSGSRAMAVGNTYGIYATAANVAYSSSTSDTPTVTVKTPTIYARCNASYFSTGAAADVNGANIYIKGRVYRVDKWSNMISAMYKRTIDLYGEKNA